MKWLSPLLALTLFATSPVFAATDWSKYPTFANVQCESPKTIADIAETARGFPAFKFATQLTVVNSKTMQTRPNLLNCKINLSMALRGKQIITGGRFMVVRAASGWVTASFEPSYQQLVR